jgi:two-component system sensor histidine kinase/response regulator
LTAPAPHWQQFAGLPGIDLAKAMDTWGDFADLQRYLRQFVLDYASCTNQFAALLGAGEPEAASALMHKLKGAAGSLSLPEVFQAARTIEDCMDEQKAATLLPALRAALDTAFASIEQLSPATLPAATPTVDLARATPLLASLLQVLEAGATAPAGPMLVELMPLVPASAMGTIQDCLDSGSARAAATLVRELARELAIVLPP